MTGPRDTDRQDETSDRTRDTETNHGYGDRPTDRARDIETGPEAQTQTGPEAIEEGGKWRGKER